MKGHASCEDAACHPPSLRLIAIKKPAYYNEGNVRQFTAVTPGFPGAAAGQRSRKCGPQGLEKGTGGP